MKNRALLFTVHHLLFTENTPLPYLKEGNYALWRYRHTMNNYLSTNNN
jgi:hypothetical protein